MMHSVGNYQATHKRTVMKDLRVRSQFHWRLPRRSWFIKSWRHWGVAFLSVCMAIFAKSFWEIRDTQAYLPVVWPIWFVVSAVSLAIFTVKPDSNLWYRLSGMFMVVGLFSRVGGAYFNWYSSDHPQREWIAILASVLYLLAGAGMWRFWIMDVGPWHDAWRLFRQSRTRNGKA